MFQVEDGKAYLVYTDHGRTGRYAIRIDSLTDDYLNSNKEGYLVLAQGHEAPAMAKYKGKYLVTASGVTGWGGMPMTTRWRLLPAGLGRPRRF